MALRIFYSWQTDASSKTNRRFIEDALRQAIRQVGEELDLDPAERPELDSDTTGVPGSPNVFETILAKIRDSEVFVADMTLVGNAANGKRIPNPNVCIEYGYALHCLGDSRLIAIMNTQFGGLDHLPFDLRTKRGPIGYSLAADTSKKECDKTTNELARGLAYAIRLVIEKAPRRGGQEHRPTFSRTQSTFNRGVFYPENGDLVYREIMLNRRVGAITPSGPIYYLRLIPTTATEPLTSHRALETARKLSPFGRVASGFSIGRNTYGAVVFEATHNDGPNWLRCITQVFKTREIWGIDYSLAERKRLGFISVKSGADYIPTDYLENIAYELLPLYLRIAKAELNLSCPLTFEIGLADVEGFQTPSDITMGRVGRPLLQPEVHHTGRIASFEDDIRSHLHPFFVKVWEETGDPYHPPRSR
jgi:hypothetical protein